MSEVIHILPSLLCVTRAKPATFLQSVLGAPARTAWICMAVPGSAIPHKDLGDCTESLCDA